MIRRKGLLTKFSISRFYFLIRLQCDFILCIGLEIASRPCTGKFRQKEGIEHVVKVLQKYVGFDYTLNEENNQIIIY